jgi:hypothetical protein
MSIPATRETLKQYALRSLGKPVIEINVDDDQLEDRIDESLQFYAQFHYDGIKRTYLKYKLTQEDKNRLKSSIPNAESNTQNNNSQNQSLLNVAITTDEGDFSCTAVSLPLTIGQTITVSGFNTGTGTLAGYVQKTTDYYIIATDGSTTFKLSASSQGSAITTTPGTTTGLTFANGSITPVSSTWYESSNYIIVPPSVVSVINILPFSDKANLNMFDVRYQLRLNDLYDFASTSIINYDMVLRHLDFLDMILVGMKPIRFQQHDNRLYLDLDWEYDLQVGEYLVIECYRKLDPNTYQNVYNDLWLKRYVTAKFKQQWGQNLSKFGGVAMLGGVTLNGEKIFTEALTEIEKLEQEIRSTYEIPAAFLIG